MATATAEAGDDGTYLDRFPVTARVVRYCFVVAFAALGVGGLLGLIQALHRTDVFRFLPSADYYTILTAHGVLLALVFTTFFIAGLFAWGLSASLERELPGDWITWGWFVTMTVGTLMAALAVIGGLIEEIPMEADVLFTFYIPLEGHPVFYIGAALLIVGSWITGYDYFRTFWAWRKDNPDERIPLRTFMVLITMLMWYLSTMGVAVEVVVFVIPWSLGLVAEIDPLLTRSLFWFFGHPVVYFWLMPAYLVWYTVLPKLSGGRLFSDTLGRIVFVLFLLLSTPVGFHHQYIDPGIAEGFKFVAMTNTMFLLLPSFLTAFTVVASIEHGARQRGGSGYLGWLRSLPWDEPAFTSCALAGLLFAAGGFSGMVNAGMNLNYVVHNTIWVPGHFHLTVGTAAALTFMGISYWLVPQLTGKRLRGRALAIIQPYLWFLGMTLMSNAMHRGGLMGLPRRTAEPEWNVVEGSFASGVGALGEVQLQVAVGGIFLFAALVLFLLVMLLTWLGRPTPSLRVDGHLPPALSGPENAPRILDNYRLWFGIAVVLVVIAYGVPLWDMVADGLFSPGSPPISP
jgi:cytochrome c oxidase subunit 1